METWVLFILVFLGLVAIDFCWTFYIAKVAEKKAVEAGLWSAGITLLSAGVVVAYTTNPVLVVAAVLGAFVGTVLAVRMNKEKPTAAGVATDPVS